jgi:hypothetical protein
MWYNGQGLLWLALDALHIILPNSAISSSSLQYKPSKSRGSWVLVSLASYCAATKAPSISLFDIHEGGFQEGGLVRGTGHLWNNSIIMKLQKQIHIIRNMPDGWLL